MSNPTILSCDMFHMFSEEGKTSSRLRGAILQDRIMIGSRLRKGACAANVVLGKQIHMYGRAGFQTCHSLFVLTELLRIEFF